MTSIISQPELLVDDFASRADGDDWGPAIQRAIDVAATGLADLGVPRGRTVRFGARDYRIDTPIHLGQLEGHWGIRLVGYGAVLWGSNALDAHDWEPATDGDALLSPDGAPMFILARPGGAGGEPEGAGNMLFEGMGFDRETPGNGAAIVVPENETPKSLTLRNLNVIHQNVGVGVNRQWQTHFDNSRFVNNLDGILLLPFTSNTTIERCTIRRNNRHGIMARRNPDNLQGSVSLRIAGNVIESNNGYGVFLDRFRSTSIIGNHIEANGGGIRTERALGDGALLVAGNHFHGESGSPHGDVDHQGHIVLEGGSNPIGGVTVMQNNYSSGSNDIILLQDVHETQASVFDVRPVVVEAGHGIPDGRKLGHANGLGVWEFDENEGANGEFSFREFALESS